MARTFVLLIFFAAGRLLAQMPAYLHYDVNDGLPGALVYCIEQDSRGFLWFGTDKGLVRFDGIRFQVFNIQDGLPDPEVLSLYHDSHERLWVSCFGKTICYRQGNRFVTTKEDPLLSLINKRSGICTFFEDPPTGDIWMADGISQISQLSNGSVEYHHPRGVGKIGRFGAKIFGMALGRIFELGAGETGPKQVYTMPEPFVKLTGPIAMDSHGNRLLYSFPQGLLLFEYDGTGFRELARRSDVVGNVFTDRRGRFWVCSSSAGAVCFDHEKKLLDDPEVYMAGKKVTHFFEDKNNMLWFATLNEGVYALPENAPVTFAPGSGTPFESGNFTALARFGDGTLATGDDSGNLYFLRNGVWEKKALGTADGYNRIRQILPADDVCYFVVSDENLSVEDSTLYFIVGRTRPGAPKSILKDGETTWYGGSSLLVRWKDRHTDYEVAMERRVTVIRKDAENNLWAGSLSGLFSQKDSFQIVWGERFLPIHGRIIDIQQAPGKALWVATPGYGLLKVHVDEGTITAIDIVNERLNAPIDNIQSIFAEPGGRVWLATNTGVYAIENDMTVHHFDEKSGLANDDVNAVLVVGDTLWAATASGLSLLRLQQPGVSSDFPTFISGVRYQAGRQKLTLNLLDTLQVEKKLVLPAGVSLLEAELSALYFPSRGNFHFICEITEKPLPIRWMTWGNLLNSLASYFKSEPSRELLENPFRNFEMSSRPGKYFTKVTAVLPGNIQSTHPDSWTFTLLPFWWQTIWFSFALAALASYVIWRLIKARMAYRQLESTASELQLQAVKAQMNPHFIGNSINAIQQFFYPPDPAKASDYISIFSDLLRRTMAFSETNFITLREELGYVRDYLEMIQLRFGDLFEFQITGAENVPPETLFPSMLLQPLLENATIHGLSPDGVSHLQLAFLFQAGKLTCTITDNGPGIEVSRSRKKGLGATRPSKGLYLLEKKVKTLNKLHHPGLTLEVFELPKNETGESGTCAVVSFYPGKIVLQPSKEMK